MIPTDRYPIGQQDFKTLRNNHALYIDKTVFVEKLAKSKSGYYFLARPRRFGKSLFLSTLKYFFKGERELFKGLYIDSTDWDWDAYPVLYLDLNTDRFADQGAFEDVLETLFMEWESKYGVKEVMGTFSQRFKTIIRRAYEKTGKQVVILVDEYDKPLVSNINKDDNFKLYREKLSSLYSNFKSSAPYIRFVFLTGVSRFSKLSVFSDLNNLNDISFDDEFADICGITENELLTDMKDGIELLAITYGISFQEACQRLKKNYDGYRFARKGSDIYNPWSVLNCLQKRMFGAFWNATGTTSVIAEALHRADVDIEMVLNADWKLNRLAGLDLSNANPTALLYQTGYLTIADYDMQYDEVRLKVPNDEVKEGLFNELLPLYLNGKDGWADEVVDRLKKAIRNGQPEEMMTSLKSYFAGVPYDLKMENENNFHNALYILLTLVGIDAKAEVHTSDGSIDLLIQTSKFLYIIELKYNASPKAALAQIEDKEYALRFKTDPRKIFCIGVNFSADKRRIESWKIAE